MKKGSKKPVKIKRQKNLKIHWWIVDGFVGILALMIYNFGLYLLKLASESGFIENLEETMGYFGLNIFLSLGFTPSAMLAGVLFVFAISFLLGMFIGNFVRKK